MDGSDTVRAEVYSDGPWQQAARDRLSVRVIHSYGLDEIIISLLLQNATVARTTQVMTNLLDH